MAQRYSRAKIGAAIKLLRGEIGRLETEYKRGKRGVLVEKCELELVAAFLAEVLAGKKSIEREKKKLEKRKEELKRTIESAQLDLAWHCKELQRIARAEGCFRQ